eukprot:scaffold340_cov256-Pinguiococcus_pyrenoidosus.AAC.33
MSGEPQRQSPYTRGDGKSYGADGHMLLAGAHKARANQLDETPNPNSEILETPATMAPPCVESKARQ